MPFNRDDLDKFPTQPGVYLMKGHDGAIIYVGKANNLRQRVRQYFMPRGDGRAIIPYLVAKVETIDTIIVTSEKEALLLENNLIKQYKPRYNALLKDDKAYIALKINDKNAWPKVSLVRYKGNPKPDGLYFGPYTSADAARQTLDLLHKLFPMRQCSDQEFARRTRPCILYDMKRCVAPCVNRCTREEYDRLVKSTVKFLRGQDKEVIKDLYEEMDRSAEALEFEKAGSILTTIQHLEKTIEGQKVDKPLGIDSDILAIFRQGDEVVLTKLIIRRGKLGGSFDFNFSSIGEEDDELLESFLVQHYSTQPELPREILLPVSIHQEDVDAIVEIICAGKRQVQILTPQRGEKKALVEMAYANAEATFKKKKDQQTIREKTLLEMQERFKLSRYPRRIECFDNSNIAGTSVVSTLVAFYEGEKDSKRYRKYKIRNLTQSDDYAAMREVLERRYKRAKEEEDLPDLLVVDGGKGHLNIAIKVLTDLNLIAAIDVIGLAKEDSRHDKGMTAEQVFLPNLKDPIILKNTSPILFMLQQIRDEAHRTAITFHRKLRSKKQVRSALDDIAGIGPAKRKILLTHFGSVKKLLEASDEEIKAVNGISETNVKAIRVFINQKKLAQE